MPYFAIAMAAIAVYQKKKANEEEDELRRKDINEINRRNKAAHENAIKQYQNLSAVEVDIIDRGHTASLSEKIRLMQEQSNLEVQASAAGVGGRSLNLMMLDLKGTHGRNMNAILDDTYTGIYNVDRQAEDIQRAAEQGQIRTISIDEDQLSKGLDIGTSGLQGYYFGSQIDRSSGETASVGPVSGTGPNPNT